MNRTHWLYIVLFCIGLLTPTSSSALNSEFNFIQSDSLQVDDSQRSSRHFDDIKNKYNDEEFIYERTIESSGWWTRFKQWLNDFFKDLFNLRNNDEAAKATNLAIRIAGVILFLLVIYFIVRAVLNKEGQWVFGKSSDKNIIPITDLESNIHAVDFKNLVTKAEKQQNYRLAIRYYYLWLLKSMSNAELIDYDVEKTNSDYHSEIKSKNTKDEFAYTSYLYNYIWYGEFDVNDTQFNKAKHAFINFLNTIKA